MNTFRAVATEELKKLEEDCSKVEDDEIYKTIVPEHLHPVLNCGGRRRAITAAHRIAHQINSLGI